MDIWPRRDYLTLLELIELLDGLVSLLLQPLALMRQSSTHIVYSIVHSIQSALIRYSLKPVPILWFQYQYQDNIFYYLTLRNIHLLSAESFFYLTKEMHLTEMQSKMITITIEINSFYLIFNQRASKEKYKCDQTLEVLEFMKNGSRDTFQSALKRYWASIPSPN